MHPFPMEKFIQLHFIRTADIIDLREIARKMAWG